MLECLPYPVAINGAYDCSHLCNRPVFAPSPEFPWDAAPDRVESDPERVIDPYAGSSW